MLATDRLAKSVMHLVLPFIEPPDVTQGLGCSREDVWPVGPLVRSPSYYRCVIFSEEW